MILSEFALVNLILELQTRMKYPTVDDRIKGLEELLSETLEWAITLAKQRETDGMSQAVHAMEVAGRRLDKELEMKLIIEQNRNRSNGAYIWYNDDKGDEVEA